MSKYTVSGLVVAATAAIAFAGAAVAEPGGNESTGPTGEPGSHRSCADWAPARVNESDPGSWADVVQGALNDPDRDEVGESGHGVPQPLHGTFCEPS